MKLFKLIIGIVLGVAGIVVLIGALITPNDLDMIKGLLFLILGHINLNDVDFAEIKENLKNKRR